MRSHVTSCDTSTRVHSSDTAYVTSLCPLPLNNRLFLEMVMMFESLAVWFTAAESAERKTDHMIIACLKEICW